MIAWSEWQDLNLRPLRPERNSPLPTVHNINDLILLQTTAPTPKRTAFRVLRADCVQKLATCPAAASDRTVRPVGRARALRRASDWPRVPSLPQTAETADDLGRCRDSHERRLYRGGADRRATGVGETAVRCGPPSAGASGGRGQHRCRRPWAVRSYAHSEGLPSPSEHLRGNLPPRRPTFRRLPAPA